MDSQFEQELVAAGARWWGGDNDENYSHGPFNTRSEALAALDDSPGKPGFLVLAEMGSLALSVGGSDFLEHLLEGEEDMQGEDGTFCNDFDDGGKAWKPEALKDLEDSVTTAIRDWAKRHDLDNTARMFSSVYVSERYSNAGSGWERVEKAHETPTNGPA